MKELREVLENMKSGTEQEREAAQLVEKMEIKNVEVGGLAYNIEDDEVHLCVNPEEFAGFDEKMKKAQVIFIYESLKGDFDRRGEGKEFYLWNIAMCLELSKLLGEEIKNQLTPSMFGFDKDLSAEEYFDLMVEEREKVVEELDIPESGLKEPVSTKTKEYIEALLA